MFISTFPSAPVTDAKFYIESDAAKLDVIESTAENQGEGQPVVVEKVAEESLAAEGTWYALFPKEFPLILDSSSNRRRVERRG